MSRFPLTDPLHRSPHEIPVLIGDGPQYATVRFANPSQCSRPKWSPGGAGRRFGVMLGQALDILGVSAEQLENDLVRKITLNPPQPKQWHPNQRWKGDPRTRKYQDMMVNGMIWGTRRPIELPRENWMWDVVADVFVQCAVQASVVGADGEPVSKEILDEYVRYAAAVENTLRDLDHEINIRPQLANWFGRYCRRLMASAPGAPAPGLTRVAADVHQPGLWDVIASGQARIESRRVKNKTKTALGRHAPSIGSGISFGRDWPLSSAWHNEADVRYQRELIEFAGFIEWPRIEEWGDAAAIPDLSDLLLFLSASITMGPTVKGRGVFVQFPTEVHQVVSPRSVA